MNAELRRYAWMELGWHRLLIAPLVLGLLAAMVIASAKEPAGTLAINAFWLFVLMTGGWGSMRALASVTEEVRDRTWDFQRMAAVTPAELALGKVFGAPIFQWYAGAWCLLVAAAAGVRAGLPNLGSMLVCGIAGATMLHALGVAASAAGARSRLGDRTRRTGSVLLGLAMLQVLTMSAFIDLRGAGDSFVRIWGWRLPASTFAAVTLVLLAGWALLAAWRTMLRELQEPARPWAWPAFALFAAAWAGGVSTPVLERMPFTSALAIASLVLTAAAYVTCLQDPLTRVKLARTVRAWHPGAGRWQPRVPAWAVHGALAIAAGGVAFALSTGRPETVAQVALPAALMAVRDVAVICCFALASSARSPVGRAVFYIALADLLVPGLAAALSLRGLAGAVFPMILLESDVPLATLGMALHAVLACAALAVCLWQALRSEPASSA